MVIIGPQCSQNTHAWALRTSMGRSRRSRLEPWPLAWRLREFQFVIDGCAGRGAVAAAEIFASRGSTAEARKACDDGRRTSEAQEGTDRRTRPPGGIR